MLFSRMLQFYPRLPVPRMRQHPFQQLKSQRQVVKMLQLCVHQRLLKRYMLISIDCCFLV